MISRIFVHNSYLNARSPKNDLRQPLSNTELNPFSDVVPAGEEERLFYGYGTGRWTDGSPVGGSAFIPYPARENSNNSDGDAGCGVLVINGGGEKYFTLDGCGEKRMSICKIILN